MQHKGYSRPDYKKRKSGLRQKRYKGKDNSAKVDNRKLLQKSEIRTTAKEVKENKDNSAKAQFQLPHSPTAKEDRSIPTIILQQRRLNCN